MAKSDLQRALNRRDRDQNVETVRACEGPDPVHAFNVAAAPVAPSCRADAMLRAVQTVRPALERFYSSLSDEQKERFNRLSPAQS